MGLFRRRRVAQDSALNLCPVCGKYVFKEKYDICPICGWEHDLVQEADPDFAGGANKLSLNEMKKEYEK